MDGDHSIERCEEVTGEALDIVFQELQEHGVELEGIILKPNMVISGSKAANRASPSEVAEATIRCLKKHVPSSVPGIAFLSGGQTSEEATDHLSLMNKFGDLPWELSFSYGRALQASPLNIWSGNEENYAAAQKALLKRAHLNSLAHQGEYNSNMET
jgi:fructose-bisphosphate aldolase class I